MSILLLTGPPASGKNTVADVVAKRLPRCAVIDAESLARMVVNPVHASAEPSDAKARQDLWIENACALIKSFDAAGYDVIMVDTLTSESVDQYTEALKGLTAGVVLLLPSEDEINSRLLSRPDYLSRGDVSAVYKQQSEFKGYDEVLDNTLMSVDDAAEWILKRWETARK